MDAPQTHVEVPQFKKIKKNNNPSCWIKSEQIISTMLTVCLMRLQMFVCAGIIRSLAETTQPGAPPPPCLFLCLFMSGGVSILAHFPRWYLRAALIGSDSLKAARCSRSWIQLSWQQRHLLRHQGFFFILKVDQHGPPVRISSNVWLLDV